MQAGLERLLQSILTAFCRQKADKQLKRGREYMSSFLYLASDMPFKEVKNPHFRQISIDEAIALGAEFPDYILNSGRSRPETVLWHDRKK